MKLMDRHSRRKVKLKKDHAWGPRKVVGDPYTNGHEAHVMGVAMTDNPYPRGTEHRELWAMGWEEAQEGKL